MKGPLLGRAMTPSCSHLTFLALFCTQFGFALLRVESLVEEGKIKL